MGPGIMRTSIIRVWHPGTVGTRLPIETGAGMSISHGDAPLKEGGSTAPLPVTDISQWPGGDGATMQPGFGNILTRRNKRLEPKGIW